VARYRKIDIRVWGDKRFNNLSPAPPNARYLWFFLLTNKHTTNIPGLYEATEEGMAASLGWPLKAFRETFQEACSEGLVKADWGAGGAGLIWIPNAIKYNSPESPNVVRSWRITWDEIQECGLKNVAWRELKAFTEDRGKGFLKAFLEACPQAIANQEQEQEQEQDLYNTCPTEQLDVNSLTKETQKTVARIEDIHLVFDHYRTKYPRRHLKPKSSMVEWKKIKARFEDGFDVSDLCKAIDGNHLSPHHNGENDQGTEYHDLELIVRDSSKVAQFIGYTEKPPQAKTQEKFNPPYLRKFEG